MDISERFANRLINMQIIRSEEKEIYSYGFRQGLLLLLNTVTIILIGLIFNMFWETMLFMVFYSSIRIYAGGYHASSPVTCYLISILMISMVLGLIKLTSWNGYLCSIIIVISNIVILLIAPTEDIKKPLDPNEKKFFKKRANIVLGTSNVLALFFWFIGINKISICIVMGVCTVSFMLLAGRIKNMSATY